MTVSKERTKKQLNNLENGKGICFNYPSSRWWAWGKKAQKAERKPSVLRVLPAHMPPLSENEPCRGCNMADLTLLWFILPQCMCLSMHSSFHHFLHRWKMAEFSATWLLNESKLLHLFPHEEMVISSSVHIKKKTKHNYDKLTEKCLKHKIFPS